MSFSDWNKLAKIVAIASAVIGGFISYKVAKWAIGDAIDTAMEHIDTLKETLARHELEEEEDAAA